MIAASIILGPQIFAHHDRFHPPFYPHLILWVIDAAIEMSEHRGGLFGYQLGNQLAKGRIQKLGFSTYNRMFLRNKLVRGRFPIYGFDMLSHVIILSFF